MPNSTPDRAADQPGQQEHDDDVEPGNAVVSLKAA